jgi:hypothetical protein
MLKLFVWEVWDICQHDFLILNDLPQNYVMIGLARFYLSKIPGNFSIFTLQSLRPDLAPVRITVSGFYAAGRLPPMRCRQTPSVFFARN